MPFILHSLFIIIIIFLSLYLISLIFNSNNTETFNTNPNSDVDKLKSQAEELEKIIQQQNRAIYLSQNFNKVSEFDYNSFIETDFDDIQLPSSTLMDKKLITNNSDLANMIIDANKFKNIYNKGDIVTNNSSFNISKDDICYKDVSKDLKESSEFKNKYPSCLVCSINNDYKNTNSYKNTKTNINKVCLFNDSPPDNSIPNKSECVRLCEKL